MGRSLEVHCTPTFIEKGSSSNKTIHFKVKGLRGDYPNSSQIVPFYPMQTMQVCCSYSLKFSQTNIFLETLWSIFITWWTFYSVGAVDF